MVYRVLADGIDIFGSDTESSLLSPSLELELNSAGSLEFTLPPDHPSYDDISLMQTEIDVYEDEDLIFFGRPAEVGIDWNKQKKVVCEGALAYLNDAAIRPHKFEGALISDVFKYIIAQYNAQVAQNKQFIVGNITITDRYVYTEFDYDICLSVLISTCIDSTGGYLFLRKEDDGIYIDWLAEVPDVSDQPVQFASNMLDLNQDTRAEDICTVVLPVGGQVDGVNITIASVNEGSDILEDSDAIAKYGRILKIQQWNDIIDPQALKDKATEWLAKQQEDDITIETDAAELHYLDGSVGAYRIGQMVNVISGPHGVDKEYPILKMSMDLDSGTKKITLGTPPRKELTELSGITNSTGGSSSSGGGGGGGSSDGVRDVLVNGSSVVSDHVARVSAVTAQQLADGLALKADEDDFEALQVAVAGKASQADLNALSNTVAGKASQADLNALSTTVSGKQDQLTPGTGISIDANNVISATGGGGTEVEANPSEAATDDLNTIKIGDTVYDIPGGGSNTNYGKFKCDVLFNTPTTTSAWANPIEICTETKAKEYDMIYLITKFVDGSSNGFISNSYLVNSIGQTSDSEWLMGIRSNSSWNDTQGFIFLSFDNSKLKFYTNTGNSSTLYKVYGLKFENKLINRSDIYSEEERMIGRWTDGKPLYQKTIIYQTPISIANGSWYTSTETYSGINIVYSDIINSSFAHYTGAIVVIENNKLVIGNQTHNQPMNNIKYITIQYTKTTDTPDSGVIPEDPMFISDPMIYSEEEQVVGSWTDGKPLYQKVIRGNFNGAYNTTVTTYYDDISSDIEDIHKLEAYAMYQYGSDTSSRAWFKNNFTRNNNINFLCSTAVGGRYISIAIMNPDWAKMYDYYMIIQYTKTTDSILSGPKKGKIVQRSDIYSEEERLIGRWTDGKPLYQKTWFNVSNNTDLVSNVDTLVDYDVKRHGNASGDVDFYDIGDGFQMTDSALVKVTNGVATYTSWTSTTGYINKTADFVTLKYTKTTDTPFSKQLIEDPQFVMMSDIYSEEEQVVGRWTDGKPLYQKTWTGLNVTPSYNVWTNIIDVSNLNIDELCEWKSMGGNTVLDGSGIESCISSNGYFMMERNVNVNPRPVEILTLQYTKTTDVPGTGPTKGNLIYLPALYSEEEREVGVWKDGKPIYQKNIPIPTIQSAQSGVLISNLGLNIDNCVDIKVRLYKDTAPDNDTVIATASFGDMYFYYRKSEDSIRMDAPFSWVVGRYGNITIQYTKTTDQPGSGTWTPEGKLAHHYSTSEKIVGTWIDGSTIYERTWDFGSNIQIPSNTWYNTSIDSTNMDRLVDVVGYADEGAKWAISGGCDGNVVELIQFRNNNIAVRYLTLQYTKTS